MPDKRQIAASFSRAAASYDSAAELQRQVGQRLLSLLSNPLPCPSPASGRGVKAVSLPAEEVAGKRITEPKAQSNSPRPFTGEGLGERVKASTDEASSPSPVYGRGAGGEGEIEHWLDIGCGSGYFTRKLAARYPNAQGIALDIAQGMLHYAKNQGGAAHWIAADAENLPFADNQLDLLFSNLCLQWCEHLEQVLSEAKRTLRSGGVFAFTSLASGTLAELQAAWQSVDNFTHVNRFRAFADYQTACAKSGLTVQHLSCRAELRHYPKLHDLTFELKALGAHNLNPNRPLGLGGRQRLAAMSQAYQQKQSAKGLPATWQVVYAVLRKES